MLSVTVATIAITGGLFPLILEAWEPKEARVSVKWISYEDEKIKEDERIKIEGIHKFVVSNVGNRPAAIAQVGIGTKGGGLTHFSPQATFELDGGSTGGIVEPGGFYSLKVRLDRGIGELIDCYVIIRFFEFPSRSRGFRFEPRDKNSCTSLSLKETGTDIQFRLRF